MHGGQMLPSIPASRTIPESPASRIDPVSSLASIDDASIAASAPTSVTVESETGASFIIVASFGDPSGAMSSMAWLVPHALNTKKRNPLMRTEYNGPVAYSNAVANRSFSGT